jgi:hypothetical protein
VRGKGAKLRDYYVRSGLFRLGQLRSAIVLLFIVISIKSLWECLEKTFFTLCVKHL